jgi:hypothetical protein
MPSAKSSGSRSRSSSGTGPSAGNSQPKTNSTPGPRRRVADSLTGLIEQLVNRIIKPLDLIVITRERIQETLDDAAERGRISRAAANELVAELVRRGRQQTDDLAADAEQLLGRGRTRAAAVDGEPVPIPSFDDLTAAQVSQRLGGLMPAELRKVRDYERRHANRKSVLTAIEKSLND